MVSICLILNIAREKYMEKRSEKTPALLWQTVRSGVPTKD